MFKSRTFKIQALEERVGNLRRALQLIEQSASLSTEVRSIAQSAVKQDDKWAEHREGVLRAWAWAE